jgi:hypothetical protein
MITDDADRKLRQLAADADFRHGDAARRAIRFRENLDVAELVAIQEDPHPCAMVDIVFALACAKRPWLNWVPMPSEVIATSADYFARRRAQGEKLEVVRNTATALEPPSAMAAFRRVVGPVRIDVRAYPAPDLRVPLRQGEYAVWRYQGSEARTAVAAPSARAVEILYEVANTPWASPLSGYLKAAPLGELPLGDLLGLLSHLPRPPATPRWDHFAETTPTYWYRFMQPWVCLGILHHAEDEPWPTSTRRKVLVDLAFGIEDWVADSALFALVTAAYREPGLRAEVRGLVRARLDAAVAAPRLVTIEPSLAHLMLATPGCTVDDRRIAEAALARDAAPPRKRRWWNRRMR